MVASSLHRCQVRALASILINLLTESQPAKSFIKSNDNIIQKIYAAYIYSVKSHIHEIKIVVVGNRYHLPGKGRKNNVMNSMLNNNIFLDLSRESCTLQWE
jgi:hypothetical protein